jgi:cell division protein FtsI (penicillin-binding protein 3)
MDKFRLNKMTGIEIVASSGKPTIKSPKNRSWSKTTIPFMAHGYEELVTPLHMLMVYNAVANNGKMMRPYLVNAIRDYGIDIKKIEPEVLVEKIVSDEALAQARECLKAVVDSNHGTGHRILFDSLYSISGKTGTAVTALDNRGYNKGNKIYQASFMGFFPSENPKYSMAVVIQNSKESRMIYGADVSGRVFKEVADRIYARFISKPGFPKNITPDTTMYNYYGMKNDLHSIFSFLNITNRDSVNAGPWRSMSMKKNSAELRVPVGVMTAARVTPDVKGMGLKDAVYLLENKGLKAVVTGKGKVVSQSLIAGTSFTKGQKIILMLN